MANILKVTTPVTGYENNNLRNNQSGMAADGVHIQNPVDPSRVLRGDNRTDAGQDGGQLSYPYESNFGTFLQMIKNAPELSKLFTELFFMNPADLVKTGISPEMADKLKEFMQAAQMEEGDLLPFIKEQAGSATRFNGGFFDVIRQVMNETSSVDLKADLLDFVRKYNDMSAAPHILDTIRNTIRDIGEYMYPQNRQQLMELLEKLDLSAPAGETDQNAALIKDQIMPMLGKYVARTHDFGGIRNQISLLTVLVSRYENSSLDGVVHAFKNLLGFQGFKKHFEGVSEERFAEVLKTIDFEKDAGKSEWTERMVDLVRTGVKGENGIENRQIFQNMVYSMVLNESVYMPLLHLMFPLNLDGRQMFSEIWVDPDDGDSQSMDPEDRTARMLIKFDIKEVGAFDLVLIYGKDTVNMQLHYPEKLKSFEGKIRKKLVEIAQKNQLTAQTVVLEAGGEPFSPSVVFPKIFERKNAINVRI